MSSFGIPVRNGLGVGLLASTSLSTRNSSAFSPTSLFAAGESGYWLDPSDFRTMWQDSQGVTPVTATGQTVGLLLDKSIGTRTQVFDDANVTFSGAAGYASRVSPGVYQYARDAGGSGTVLFGGLTAGKTYLVSVQLSPYAGPIPGITLTGCGFINALNAVIRPNAGSAGTYTFFYLADGTFFRMRATNVNMGGTISNVSILEVPGNHFLQATAASRPLVQTDGTNIYLSFDGTDDWLQSAATIDPGAVDKAQVFAGVRKLSGVGNPMLLEASVEAISNNGAISVASSGATYTYGSRGTTFRGATGTTFAAPITNVLTGTSDISGDSVILRVNGEQVAINTFNQGTGNYLTYTHYIGRRGGTTQPYDGQLYSLIVRYGPNLDAAIITQSENYVNSKTGAF